MTKDSQSKELTLQDLRVMGGNSTKRKYGSAHYKRINLLSQASKRRKKEDLQSKALKSTT